MKLREINTLNDFESIKDEWNNLLDSCENKNIFLTWEWNFLWYKHYQANRMLSILLYENEEGIKGIMPFASRNFHHLIAYLENIGIYNSDYGGIIISDKSSEITEEIFDNLAGFIKKSKLPLRMYETPENTKIYEELKSKLSANGIFVRSQSMSSCPYLSLHGSWEDYWAKLSGHLKKDICGKKRKFEKQIGEISFRKSLCIEELENDFNIFLQLQSKRRYSKGVEQISDEEKDFLYDVSKSFLSNNWLNLSFLEVNGNAISCSLGFEYNNVYYYYLPAFDPSYYSYPLGKIHITYILKELFDKGFKEFDFLRGDEEYKSLWKPSKRTNERIIACNCSFGFDIKSMLINYLIKYGYIPL